MNIAFFIVESALFGLFVWLGLFLLSRVYLLQNTNGTMWRYPALYCGAGTLLFAGFLLGVAMQSMATTATDYVLWQKLTWWTVPIGAAFYGGATLLLYVHLQSGSYPALLNWKSYWMLLALACMIAFGTTGDWFLYYDRLAAVVTPYEAFHVPFRLPHYYGYALFVVSLLVGSSLLLLKGAQEARHRSSSMHIRWRWLGIGGLIIMFGGLLSIVGYAILDRLLPEQLGDLVVAIGAAVVGYGVVKHNALESRFVGVHDFEGALLHTTLMALGYNLLFWGASVGLNYQLPPIALPLLLLLAILAQSPLDGPWLWVERLLLPPWLADYRRQIAQFQLTMLASSAPTQTLDQTEREFQDAVLQVQLHNRAVMIEQEIEYIFQYNRFWDDQVLAASRLCQLQLFQRASDANAPTEPTARQACGQAMRIWLRQTIDRAFATAAENPATLSTDQIAFLILQKKYIENLSRNEVERLLRQHYGLTITGGTYTRHVKLARQRLAALIDRHERDLTTPAA